MGLVCCTQPTKIDQAQSKNPSRKPKAEVDIEADATKSNAPEISVKDVDDPTRASFGDARPFQKK